MKKTILCILLGFLSFSVAGCIVRERSTQRVGGVANNVIAFELRTDHEFYESGEPVNVHVALTNVTDQVITLQSKTGVDPVLDLHIQRGPDQNPIEKRVWSDEHPDDVRYTLTLEPGESYEVEWTQVLSTSDVYSVGAVWIDSASAQRKGSISILYDYLP